MAMWNPWRGECWDMIRERSDCQFLFLTKRIERFLDCVPQDWGEGWNNAIVGCTVETQKRSDEEAKEERTLAWPSAEVCCSGSSTRQRQMIW